MAETTGANFEASDVLRMFPSWLAHSVDAGGSDETRISVGFNHMFSAFAQKMSQPLR